MTQLDEHRSSRSGDRWRQAIAGLEVPEHIRARAEEPEWTLEPERFRWRPDEDAKQPIRPSRRRALEAVPAGGSVLDVGVGGGASSLGLVPRVGLIVGVDPLPEMLELFQASARASGVDAKGVLGDWPDVADQVEPVDVAVSHHAVYRVVEVEDFVLALTASARNRVVLELSEFSPLTALNPLWKALHGIDRPDFAAAEEAHALLVELGLKVEREDMVLAPRLPEVTPELVAFVRRRVYASADRDPEIEDLLRAREPREQRVTALWWPGEA